MNLEAPVGYTCTTIDNIKTDLLEALNYLSGCDENLSINKLFENIEDAVNILKSISGRHSELEDVRSDNAELRDWGYELVSHILELESEIDVLGNYKEY